MDKLLTTLQQTPIVYITRDIERALGLPLDTKGYYIITNQTPFAKQFAGNRKNVLLVSFSKQLSTRELLEKQQVIDYIKEIPNAQILVFKNTAQIEKACAERGWPLLNPKASLANLVEEKISQISWLGDLAKYLPPYKILLVKDITWQNKKFVIQFNRTHTGNGTILITSAAELKNLQTKFPNREARVAPFIDGPLFTNNNAIWNKNVLISEPSYQITGLKPFTNIPFATIGNDWALPTKLLSNKQSKQIKQIAIDVAEKLSREGWRGLFGIDVIAESQKHALNQAKGSKVKNLKSNDQSPESNDQSPESNDQSPESNDQSPESKVYLLEINARQAASVTFESELQRRTTLDSRLLTLNETNLSPNTGDQSLKSKDQSPITTFEAHLAGLLNLKYENEDVTAVTNGAQIIKRVILSKPKAVAKKTKKLTTSPLQKSQDKLTKAGFNVIPYNNSKPGEDLLRIQGKEGIMLKHNKFNKVGEKIKKIIK